MRLLTVAALCLLTAGISAQAESPDTSNGLATVQSNGKILTSLIPNGVPAGGIILIITGSCPTGFTEVTSLSGKFLLGTVTANSDVGSTGGADNITPQGTVSQAQFTGASTVTFATSGGTPAGTVSQAQFTGASTITFATSGGTPAGTISALTTGADSSTTGGVAKAVAQTPTFTGSALATHTHQFISSGTVTSQTFAGNALATHTHQFVSSGTVTSQNFSGTQFDNRPAFMKVIFCQKT